MERIINGVRCTFKDPDALSQACVGIFDALAHTSDEPEEEPP